MSIKSFDRSRNINNNDHSTEKKGLASELPPKQLFSDNTANTKVEENSNTESNSPDNPYQLPTTVQAKMEDSFGQDFSDVNIHRNSSEAKEMNALAYTQGTDIHFAPGQFNPDSTKGQELIGHELAHVVQQKQGRVKSTIQEKGKGINEDSALEREADTMGAKAANGQPTQYKSSALGIRNSLRSGVTQAKMPIQRKVNSIGGAWDTERYDLRENRNNQGEELDDYLHARGLDIALKFMPDETVNASKIGLVQSVVSQGMGVQQNMSETAKNRSLVGTRDHRTDKGLHIDRRESRNNPVYGSTNSNSLEQTPESNNRTDDPLKLGNSTNGGNATYQLGYRKQVGDNWETQYAGLYDGPMLTHAKWNSKQVFETTAIALDGAQEGMFYGSVQWGWQTDPDGNFTKLPLKVVSNSVPTSAFLRAARKWNSTDDSRGRDSIDLPSSGFATISVEGGINLNEGLDSMARRADHLPEGTKVEIIGSGNGHGSNFVEVRILEGEDSIFGAVGFLPNDVLTEYQ